MTAPNALATQHSAQAWQAQLEQGLEAGQTPLLELGVSQRLLDGWAAQRAFDAFHQTRVDLLTPTLLIGGSSVLWPTMLLHAADLPGLDRPVPSLALLYGGADQATYMASVTTMAAERLLAGRFQIDDLPASMHPGLLPLTNQSVPLPWSALPLHMVNPPAVAPTALTAELAPTAVDPWLVWSALSLVVLIVLLALFV